LMTVKAARKSDGAGYAFGDHRKYGDALTVK
jgi:hypothetical protein